MPTVHIKTIESKVGWTNPNNPEMISYDLTIQVGDKQAEARTFSHAISEVGFEGEVETYEKKDHTYLKQVRTENYMNYDNKPKSSTDKPAYKDNSDGMRQGMCINNAANYINGLTNELMSTTEWAEMVWSYANSLYTLGDLKKDSGNDAVPVTDEDISKPVDLSQINSIFSGK